MHISWLGGTAVKIQAKPFDQDVVLVIDPYKPETGNFPRNLTASVALYTRGEKDSITISGDPFTLSIPGECENKGVLITSVQGEKPNETMFRVDAEDISVAHLGQAGKQLNDTQLSILSGVDVLLVPVGGKDCYDAEAAVKVINSIEPRVIIPIAYKSDNDTKSATVESFLKEMGSGPIVAEKKVILRKKDLPQEEMQIVVLAKE
ncbi:MAG: MBL fold metallo-hydrolase [bacterium]|nr:MBL fold metallo-hydrolase [bacterium]